MQRSKPQFQFENVKKPVQFSEETLDSSRYTLGQPLFSVTTDRNPSARIMIQKQKSLREITSISQLYNVLGVHDGQAALVGIQGHDYKINLTGCQHAAQQVGESLASSKHGQPLQVIEEVLFSPAFTGDYLEIQQLNDQETVHFEAAKKLSEDDCSFNERDETSGEYVQECAKQHEEAPRITSDEEQQLEKSNDQDDVDIFYAQIVQDLSAKMPPLDIEFGRGNNFNKTQQIEARIVSQKPPSDSNFSVFKNMTPADTLNHRGSTCPFDLSFKPQSPTSGSDLQHPAFIRQSDNNFQNYQPGSKLHSEQPSEGSDVFYAEMQKKLALQLDEPSAPTRFQSNNNTSGLFRKAKPSTEHPAVLSRPEFRNPSESKPLLQLGIVSQPTVIGDEEHPVRVSFPIDEDNQDGPPQPRISQVRFLDEPTTIENVFYSSMMGIVNRSLRNLSHISENKQQPSRQSAAPTSQMLDLREESSDEECQNRVTQAVMKDLQSKVRAKVYQFSKEMGVKPDIFGMPRELSATAGVQEDSLFASEFVIKTKLQLQLVKQLLKTTFHQTSIQKQCLTSLDKKVNRKIDKFQSLFDKMQQKSKKLHFAFLFACPLVMSYQMPENTQTKYKLIPALNHLKEFEKIAKRLDTSNARVHVVKRQCTIDNLKVILQDQPNGIHFSGHGLKNTVESVGEYHYLHKDEGDFLLMETAEGDSQLVSRKQMQSLIKTTGTVLNFVFIATCHSEFVGRIFLEAGAKHVICIDQQEEVMDDAIISFTDTFYDMILRQTVAIPEAFNKAQLVVNISFGQQESIMFKLLNADKVQEQDPDELYFGPFDEGKWANNDQEIVMDTLPQKVASMVGRQKDMFKLIGKIMSERSSRLITAVGLPGIGKTALVKNTIHHLQERRLLHGGCIFSNAQNIQDCEVYLKQFIAQVLLQNKLKVQFAQIIQNLQSSQVSDLEKLNSLLQVIGQLQGQVLLVIDNAEDLICEDKVNFRNVVRLILLSCPNMRMVLTSRVRMASLPEFTEEIFIVGELSPLASWQLFKQMTRDIVQPEINMLLKVQPDQNQYPQETFKPAAKRIHEHHLFTLLGGNPQAIILVAPLLADHDKQLTLSGLYQMLTSNQVQKILAHDQVEDKMMASLHVCLQVSVQILIESEPASLKLFFLLSMLPGGATDAELDYFWECIREPTPLHQSILQLEKYKLVERKVRQSTGETKILLTKFVASFAEAMIEDSQKEMFHRIIVTQMHANFSLWYQTINNTAKPKYVEETEALKRSLVSCEQNLWSVIQRMAENCAHQVLKVEDVDKRQSISTQQWLTMQQKAEITNGGKEWGYLRQATEKLSIEQRQLQVIDRFRTALNANPRKATSAKERAKLWWKLAYKKVRRNLDQKKRNEVKIQLETVFTESDFTEDEDEECISTEHALDSLNYEEKAPNKPFNYDSFTPLAQKRVKSNHHLLYEPDSNDEKQSSAQLKTLFRTQTAQGVHQKIKDIQSQCTSLQFQRRRTGTESQASKLKDSKDMMTVEEQLLCYYIFSLILLKQCVIVLRLIKKFLIKFTQCSSVFQGNVLRAKAVCCMVLINDEHAKKSGKGFSHSERQQAYSPVADALQQALQLFSQSGCSWGSGLTEFHLALLTQKTENTPQAKKHYIEAIKHFSKVNHYRGISISYKNLSLLHKSQKGFDMGLVQTYWDEHHDNLIRWRTSTSKLQDFLSIQRAQGDDFTLQCEIVLMNSCHSLHTLGNSVPFYNTVRNSTLKKDRHPSKNSSNPRIVVEEWTNESFVSSSLGGSSKMSQTLQLKRYSGRSLSSLAGKSETSLNFKQRAHQTLPGSSGLRKHSFGNVQGLMLESNTSYQLSKVVNQAKKQENRRSTLETPIMKQQNPNNVHLRRSSGSSIVGKSNTSLTQKTSKPNFDTSLSPIKLFGDRADTQLKSESKLPLMSMTLTYKPVEASYANSNILKFMSMTVAGGKTPGDHRLPKKRTLLAKK